MSTYKATKGQIFTIKAGRIRLVDCSSYKLTYSAHSPGKPVKGPLVVGISNNISEEEAAYLLDDLVKYLRRKKKRPETEKIFADIS